MILKDNEIGLCYLHFVVATVHFPKVNWFSRLEYWSGLPCPSPRDLPHPGIEPTSLTAPALACRFFTISATWEAQQKRWTTCKTRQKLKMPSTSSSVDPTQVKKDQTLRQVKRNYPNWRKEKTKWWQKKLSLSDSRDNFKHSHRYVIGISEEKRREWRNRGTYEETMPTVFPNLT